MATAITKQRTRPEVIEAGKVYPVAALGLGPWALRSARAAGLKLRYTLGRVYVRGEDWIDFISQQATTPPNGRRGRQQAETGE